MNVSLLGGKSIAPEFGIVRPSAPRGTSHMNASSRSARGMQAPRHSARDDHGDRLVRPAPATPLHLALLGTLLQLYGAPAHPSARTPAYLADLSLEQLSEIVVTSVSRREENVADAAAAVFVISSEDIRRSGATTLPEVLRLAPNLDVARADGNQYVISARGFNNILADKLLVMIDGRTVYTPLFSGVWWEAQSVMLEDIERIEVVSGPGGTIWGTNAVNGVINVITRGAGASQGTLVSIGAGNRERGAATRYGGELANGGHYRVYGTYRNSDHTERASGANVQDGANHRQAGFRADWGAAADAFTFQGDVYTADIDQPLERREIGGANLLARWARDLGHGNNLNLQLYYDRTTRDHPGLLEEVLDIWDVSFHHGLRQHARHYIVWGGGHRYARDDVDNGPAVGFIPPDRNLRWSNLFVQDNISLSDDLDLTAGVRMERNDYTGTEWMPNLRLAWRFAADQMLWGSVARAVRAPSRVDREYFAPPTPPHGFAGGPDFESEVADVAELGYRAQPVAGLSYSVTVFHSEYDRLRTFEATPIGHQMGNEAEATTQGIETWGSYRVSRDWRLRAGWVVMHEESRLKPGSTHNAPIFPVLGNDPSHWWSLRSSLDITPQHQFDVAVRRIGERPHPLVPAYTAVDARLAWLPRKSFELSLNVQNLFDPGHPEWADASVRVDHERSFYLKAVWQL